MKIPEKLQISGKEYQVIIQDVIKEKDNSKSLGIIKYTETKILIAKENDYGKCSKESINHTFLHEAVHGALSAIGYEDMSSDEKFVDSFSDILYQIIKQI